MSKGREGAAATAAERSSNGWSPSQYERFRKERAQPFYDLLAMVVPRPGIRVADLGCGTGELTRQLHRSLGANETLGIDSSASMLARSGEFTDEGMRFVQGDLREVVCNGCYDLIFSNAALQWLPDHPELIAQLAGSLSEHGQLAVQMPANHDHLSHEVARIVAQQQPFVEALEGYQRGAPVLPIESYAELFHQLGFTAQRAEMRVYPHLLSSPRDVVEWVRGTLLIAYLERLPAELRDEFVERYSRVWLRRAGDKEPYLFAFKRILLWASR